MQSLSVVASTEGYLSCTNKTHSLSLYRNILLPCAVGNIQWNKCCKTDLIGRLWNQTQQLLGQIFWIHFINFLIFLVTRIKTLLESSDINLIPEDEPCSQVIWPTLGKSICINSPVLGFLYENRKMKSNQYTGDPVKTLGTWYITDSYTFPTVLISKQGH